MMAPYAVRSLATEDLPDLSQMHQDMLGSWSLEIWKSVLRDPHAKGEALCKHEKLIGFIVWRLIGHEGEILTLYLLPQHRRQGLGQLLVDSIVKKAKRLQAKLFYIEVAETNHAGLEFYKKLGFSRVGMRPHYYKIPNQESIDAMVMKKDV